MNGYVGIALLVTISSVCAVLGVFIAKRSLNRSHLLRHQSFVDSMLNVVGMLISILLGLLVAGALDRFERIDNGVATEADCVAQVFRISSGLPQEVRVPIRRFCRRYNEAVLSQEWTLMTTGKMSEQAWDEFSKLEQLIVTFKPRDNGESNTQNALISATMGIGEGRRNRKQILMSSIGFVPVLVGIFCAITMIFTFLYVTRGIVLHSLLTAFVATCLSLNVGMLYILSEPFKRTSLLQPYGFSINREMFDRISLEGKD